MTETTPVDPLARVRDIALLLPGAHEQSAAGATTFLVDQRPFATVNADGTCVALRSGDGADAWSDVMLDDATDWTLVEDRVARSWELSAPAGLLEAGGR